MTEQRGLTRRSLLRWVSAGGAAVVAGSILAACGASKEGPSPATSVPTSAVPTTATTRAAGSASSGTTAATPAATTASAAGLPTANPARFPAPAGKKEITFVQGPDIVTLDPHLSTAGNDTNATFNIFDNLVFRDVNNQLQPMLATEWTTTGDTQWTFKLRKDVTFHNGDPFTAADVKFTIERTYDPAAKTLVATVFTTIDKIETPDDYTVVFNTKQPDPLLPARLAFYGGQIMPAKYFQQVGAGFADKPVGSGPYKFVEQVKDDRVVLEANSAYWGGAPTVSRVTIKPRPETAARIASLISGESDLAANIPPDQTDQVNRSGKTRTEPALYAGLWVLGVNSKVAPLSNKLVKQALALAVDRQSIIKEIFRGQGLVPNGGIAAGDFAYDGTLPPLAYDPTKAKALLKQANYYDEEIIIETTQGYIANDRQMAEAIVQMWKDVGINAKAELIEISVRAQKNASKSFKGMWWTDPTSTVLDPDGMMWRLLGPGASQDYWRDEEWDKLGAEARTSLDANLRLKDYKRMNEIFRENFPWIPVLQPVISYGAANYVNFRYYSNGYLNLRKENLNLVTG
jgi:peptide/nickel transport system substrate-binding protein